jgi:threonine dehydrogenase-like Zn-dependent dehydrogenase
MKAAQFYGKRDIRVVDVPKPEPKDNEALVAIDWCGICGSDLHEYLIGLQLQ